MWSDVVEAETIRVPVVPGMVAVIGLGRIGLPMAVQYAARGWRVVACDANERVGENIKSELRSLYEEPALKSELSGLIERGLLSATTNTAAKCPCQLVRRLAACERVWRIVQGWMQARDFIWPTALKVLRWGAPCAICARIRRLLVAWMPAAPRLLLCFIALPCLLRY